jgi:ribosomal subunit interface protein
MQIPLQIRFKNLDPSPAIEAAVRKRADQLERFADRITSCRVTIEAPHKHHRQGNLYQVTVDVRTPGDEVVVSRSPGEHHAHEDAYVAIRDAFNATRRQLQNHVRVQRGKVKSHDVPAHGKITGLYPRDDYGTITDNAGREIYFHRNSVVNADFDSLEIAAEVRFDEEAGDKGPQASSVYRVGKHHIAS